VIVTFAEQVVLPLIVKIFNTSLKNQVIMRIQTIITLLLISLATTGLYAQYGVVQEVERNMSFGVRPCFRLEFVNADDNMVEDMWKDYAKKAFSAKLKKDKKTGEWSATKLSAPVMGSDPFAIYSTIEKMNNGYALNVWFDNGAQFLRRKDNNSRAEEVSRTLRQFYFEVRRAVISKEIKMEEDKLKDMEKKYKSIQKDNDGLRKDIDNYKAKIQKAEQDIVTNDKNLEQNLKDQESQRNTIEEVRKRLANVENERN
jgi:hypothetical protein